jgi:hypothetical protein
MDFETALQVKQSVATILGLGGERTRGRRRRLAVGVATTQDARDFRIAVRAQSQEDLDRAWEKGMEERVRKASPDDLDVRITGPIVAGQPPDAVSPVHRLRIGASISHRLGCAGTLGFFARRVSDKVVGIVSNNHVLARCDRGRENDEIIYPGADDQDVLPEDVIAYLERGYPRLDVRKPLVDCAFARLRDGISYDPVNIAEGLKLNPAPVNLREQREVIKCGGTTGLTHGRITAFALDSVDVDYGFRVPVIFNQQIEIEPAGEDPFSKPGDSGSLVVNPGGNPVGLSFAGTMNCLISYANPIENVLKSLGVTVHT